MAGHRPRTFYSHDRQPWEGQHVTKVRIDTPGVTVEVDADGNLADVAARALQLYRDAGGWPQPAGAAVGFASTERRPAAAVQPSGMRCAPGPYPVQTP
jgi:hypothetical protein